MQRRDHSSLLRHPLRYLYKALNFAMIRLIAALFTYCFLFLFHKSCTDPHYQRTYGSHQPFVVSFLRGFCYLTGFFPDLDFGFQTWFFETLMQFKHQIIHSTAHIIGGLLDIVLAVGILWEIGFTAYEHFKRPKRPLRKKARLNNALREEAHTPLLRDSPLRRLQSVNRRTLRVSAEPNSNQDLIRVERRDTDETITISRDFAMLLGQSYKESYQRNRELERMNEDLTKHLMTTTTTALALQQTRDIPEISFSLQKRGRPKTLRY